MGEVVRFMNVAAAGERKRETKSMFEKNGIEDVTGNSTRDGVEPRDGKTLGSAVKRAAETNGTPPARMDILRCSYAACFDDARI